MEPLLAIRHGESTMNAARVWQGQADAPLTPRGREQAQRLADALAGRGVAALVTSDLARARQTADILAERLGLTPWLEPDLREMDVGSWSARPHAELLALHPDLVERVRGGDWDVRPGGGETRREVRARALAALARARARCSSGLLGVVTHMGVLRALVPGITLANAEARLLEGTEIEGSAAPGELATASSAAADAGGPL